MQGVGKGRLQYVINFTSKSRFSRLCFRIHASKIPGGDGLEIWCLVPWHLVRRNDEYIYVKRPAGMAEFASIRGIASAAGQLDSRSPPGGMRKICRGLVLFVQRAGAPICCGQEQRGS